MESVRLDFGSGGHYDECCLIYPQLVAFFKQFSLKTNLKRILRKDHDDVPVELRFGVNKKKLFYCVINRLSLELLQKLQDSTKFEFRILIGYSE